MFTHLSLRLRIFLFFALLALGGAALLTAGLVIGYVRLGEDHALSAFITAGAVGAFAIIGLSAWVWTKFDEYVARPLEALAADMRARAHADVDDEINPNYARYLGDLAPAAAAVAAHLTETRNAMALAVGRETARLGLEKQRLETLLAEIPDGVVFCTPDHKIALYNGKMRDLFNDDEGLGLNRPLDQLLRMAPLREAYGRLLRAQSAKGTDILVTTRHDARLFEARMRLFWLEGQETADPAYLLCLQDRSKDLALHGMREALFADLIEAVDAVLPDLPQGAPRAQLEKTLRDVQKEKAKTDTAWWPLEQLDLSDIAIALATRLAQKDIQLQYDALPDLRLRADGFAISRLLERLTLSWIGAGASDIRLSARLTEGEAILDVQGDAKAPDAARLNDWLDSPLITGHSRFAGADVLRSHGAKIETTDQRISLSLAAAPEALQTPRVIQYDFDLLQTALPAELSQAPLKNLSFVVFDTETTGLNPQVDEICQIAAMRIVNGKLVESERFDTLVNPARKIPAASTAVHHITNEMVADAPSVVDALSRFHRFADGAVLVAHNAPFDMAFLQRREAAIGARFDQPILDTVLCSAILFGQSAEHTLDALCDRLSIRIPDNARHTALGDTLGTARAFVKMLPMLEATDIQNLGQLITAFDRHARLLRHLN